MGYYTNDKSTKTSSLANPTSLNLQPRPFAPLQSDEKEETVARKSGYSENFLEKIINTPRSESATPVQRKSGNRLKAIAAERNNAALQNQPIQRQESVEEKNEGKQEVAKEFIMNPEPPPVQRKLENHLRAKNAQKMAIQAKLAIGEPNDKYEQESDATAARVVQQINSPITSQSQPVQRKFENHLRAKNAQKMALQPKLAIGDPNGKYEQEADATAARGIQQINSPTNDASTASLTQSVQRQEMQEDEELQMKSLVQRRENIGGGEASTDLESSIQSARGSGQSLDANLQRSMGQAMGADFSGVKVHTDSQSDQLNKSIQAKAFTTGQDVFFRQGAYEPSSRGGQELIAHELTHVVQQGASVQRKSNEEIAENNEPLSNEPASEEIAENNEPLSNEPASEEIAENNEPLSNEPASEEMPTTEESSGATSPTTDSRHILKFNFAGSGEETWKTRKAGKIGAHHKPDKEGTEKQQMPGAEHTSGGVKYSKEKAIPDGTKKVFEYAGPLVAAGAIDSGSNSTVANLADAKQEFTRNMQNYIKDPTSAPAREVVQINIKGFSRGAATASVFASWIKGTEYKDFVRVNLVLFDPVHGGSMSHMPGEQDVSSVYDENAPDSTSGTTCLMPIKSGRESYTAGGFASQKISGYQRLIIVYGPDAKHSYGRAPGELKYNNEEIQGMELSTLPKGLFVVNAADGIIKQVFNMNDWKKYEPDVLGYSASKSEGRTDIIQNSLKSLQIRKLMTEREFYNATGGSSLRHPRAATAIIDSSLREIDKQGPTEDLLNNLLSSIDYWLKGKAGKESARKEGVLKLRDQANEEMERIRAPLSDETGDKTGNGIQEALSEYV
ncbi:MAG: DUF4157 domain-containing protein [Pseudanabaena sp. Salubria-1]|nr:DUF4157 domain-containing protein [Pseudanabaena sp. Salubria-1]